MSIGLKVLAFIHESPDNIPVGKSDIEPILRGKLDAFRNRVSESRLVKFWRSAAELPGLVALSPHFSSIPENGVGGARGMGFHGLEAASPLGGAAVGQKRPGMLSATLAEAFFVCFWANLDCRPCRALCASSIT